MGQCSGGGDRLAWSAFEQGFAQLRSRPPSLRPQLLARRVPQELTNQVLTQCVWELCLRKELRCWPQSLVSYQRSLAAVTSSPSYVTTRNLDPIMG